MQIPDLVAAHPTNDTAKHQRFGKQSSGPRSARALRPPPAVAPWINPSRAPAPTNDKTFLTKTSDFDGSLDLLFARIVCVELASLFTPSKGESHRCCCEHWKVVHKIVFVRLPRGPTGRSSLGFGFINIGKWEHPYFVLYTL